MPTGRSYMDSLQFASRSSRSQSISACYVHVCYNALTKDVLLDEEYN